MDSFVGGGGRDVGYFSGYAEVSVSPCQTIETSHATTEASSSIPVFQGVHQYGVAVGGEIEGMGGHSTLGQNKKKHAFIQIELSIRYSHCKEALFKKQTINICFRASLQSEQLLPDVLLFINLEIVSWEL